MGDLPPVLLADATWYGTLAALRNLNLHGVPVTLASDSLMAPARWSRHVTHVHSCPSTKNADRFLDWLLQFGAKNPGHVLYPTSDETAWLVSANSEALSDYFQLYAPPVSSLVRLLDKACLAEEARAAGLDVPECRVPRDEAEAAKVASEIGFPIYVKPRAQVCGTGLGKGELTRNLHELRSAWRAHRDRSSYQATVLKEVPDLFLPMLQQAITENERIYSVDGFADATGELYISLACVELLQRPRGSGAGILIEHAGSNPAVDAGLKRLFQNTGYFGVFDAEFLECGEQLLLIDINPRFFGHMAFEIDRGLQLPWLAYLAAKRDWEALRQEVTRAQLCQSGCRRYVQRLPTALLLAMQRLKGAMSIEDQARWRSFLNDSNASYTEPARAPNDPGPAIAEIAMEAFAFLRHPRAYLKGLWRSPNLAGRQPKGESFIPRDGRMPNRDGSSSPNLRYSSK
jgi:D-aspartate ligase